VHEVHLIYNWMVLKTILLLENTFAW